MTHTGSTLDERDLQALEAKFDPEMRFRPLAPPAITVVGVLLILLSVFHYYTAGFGQFNHLAIEPPNHFLAR